MQDWTLSLDCRDHGRGCSCGGFHTRSRDSGRCKTHTAKGLEENWQGIGESQVAFSPPSSHIKETEEAVSQRRRRLGLYNKMLVPCPFQVSVRARPTESCQMSSTHTRLA
ncbi:hypothetical protein RRG08_034199 [Elysia crispata]|uniref:Uncharacterized protein n=1 Tax=Elysia crispata TaxID=231223 RepID=A0AAE1DQ37_9GAST|nr:hypothetical protein RRG08_034199 [Elysia crispata]